MAPKQTPEWLGEEKGALRWAVEKWLGQVGVDEFPDDVIALC